jgi:hypothetical protein
MTPPAKCHALRQSRQGHCAAVRQRRLFAILGISALWLSGCVTRPATIETPINS